MTFTRNRMLLTAGLLAVSLTLPAMSDPPANGNDGGKQGAPPVGGKDGKGGGGLGSGNPGGRAPGREGGGRDGAGREKAREMAAARGNPMAWNKALEAVMPTLSDDQKSQIKTLRDDFENKMKAWKEQNGAKEQELREKIKQSAENSKNNPGAGDKGGDKGGDGKSRQPARNPIDPELLKQMKELNDSRPNPTEMQGKVMAILNTEQQAAFKQEFEKVMKEGGTRGGERGERRGEKDGKEGGKEDHGTPPARKNGDGKPSGS